MRAKTNRLMMLLVGVAIAGCASQTDRSSSGGGDQARPEAATAAAEAAPPPPAPAYEPEREAVQFSDRPLDETPPPKPAPVAKAPKEEEAIAEFPITKYELPEEQEEEVEDLGTQEDESVSAEQEALAEEESSVGETTEYAEEVEEDEVDDLGTQEDESASAEQEAAPEQESSVGESTEYAEETEEDEIDDLGTQEDESASAEQEAAPEQESSVGETTEYAEQEEEAEEVGDLGTQQDDSGTVSYPEEKRAAADNLVGEPKVYADEPASTPKAVPPPPKPATPKSVSINFETEPLFGFDKSEVRSDQRAKLDELISSLGGAEITSISVLGYADRIGGKAYNQKLSERRAQSVRNYLVSKGIPADRIHTEGRGQSDPVTGDACKKERGKKLISCLQPDRRVDVGVSGSKRSN